MRRMRWGGRSERAPGRGGRRRRGGMVIVGVGMGGVCWKAFVGAAAAFLDF